MKAIKERAKDYADMAVNVGVAQKLCRCEGYIIGATEQKAIDDEQLPTIKETYYNAGYETAKNKMVEKACEWLKARNVLTDASLEGFKKAMEE